MWFIQNSAEALLDNEVVTPENIKKARKIILENRKVKLQEIVDIMKMSKSSVFTILYEHLSMRKRFSKWVLRSLTADQKQQRVDASEESLGIFKRYKTEFFRRYITMAKVWDSPLYAGI